MMGVCQWMIVEDTIAALLESNHIQLNNNQNQIALNALLFKDNLTPVCEIKLLTLQCVNQPNSNEWMISTNSVKKILFKQRVFPGDTIYCLINNIEIID